MNKLHRFAITSALCGLSTIAVAVTPGSEGSMGADKSAAGATPSTQTAPKPSDDKMAAKPSKDRMQEGRDQTQPGHDQPKAGKGNGKDDMDAANSKQKDMTQKDANKSRSKSRDPAAATDRSGTNPTDKNSARSQDKSTTGG